MQDPFDNQLLKSTPSGWESIMMQKEGILSAAFRKAVVEMEGLDAKTYMLDANAILQYGRVIIGPNGEETFFYKDQPVITFFRPELHHETESDTNKFIFSQSYKAHL